MWLHSVAGDVSIELCWFGVGVSDTALGPLVQLFSLKTFKGISPKQTILFEPAQPLEDFHWFEF